MPQVYYVGALAGGNDMDLLNRTHVGRDINRHYYTVAEIDENLERPVVKALNALCRLRNTLDAFDGEFSHEVDGDTSITFRWQGRTSSAALTFEPGRGLGADNATPVASLAWTDDEGAHRHRRPAEQPAGRRLRPRSAMPSAGVADSTRSPVLPDRPGDGPRHDGRPCRKTKAISYCDRPDRYHRATSSRMTREREFI